MWRRLYVWSSKPTKFTEGNQTPHIQGEWLAKSRHTGNISNNMYSYRSVQKICQKDTWLPVGEKKVRLVSGLTWSTHPTKCQVNNAFLYLGNPGKLNPKTKGAKGDLMTHLMHRHVKENIVILDEGNHPIPICNMCDMFVPWKEPNSWQYHTDMCNWGSEQKRCQIAAEVARGRYEIAFMIYGKTF